MRTNYVEMLVSKGIRPSPQRVAILESLRGRCDHPTAEMMFEDLRPGMPTLSKTTVLSTMRLLQGAGLIRDVRCEEGELRFDGNAGFHAHFKCRGCGTLEDIEVKGVHQKPYVELPKGFSVDDEQVIYYGFCAKCQKKGKAK